MKYKKFEMFEPINDQIVSILDKQGKFSFNNLLRELNKSFPKSTRDTLSDHLERLEKANVIDRDPPPQSGKPRYCWLTDKTRNELEWKVYSVLKSNRNQKINLNELTDTEKTKLGINLLLYASFMGEFIKHPIEGEVKDPSKHNRKSNTMTVTNRDFKLSDFIDKDTKLSKRFELGILTDAEIKKLFDFLIDKKIIEESGIDNDTQEPTYVITPQSELDRFLLVCYNALHILIKRVELVTFWEGISIRNKNKDQKNDIKQQLKWYRLITNGNRSEALYNRTKEKKSIEDKYVKDFYNTHKNIPRNNRKNLKENYVESRKLVWILRYDEILSKSLEWIKGESYKKEERIKIDKVKQNYPIIYKLMMEMLSPHFLENSMQEYERKSKRFIS